MMVIPNYPWPVPVAGSKDWAGTAELLRHMASDAQDRANELTRPETMRAAHQATADAYAFAALLIDIQLDPHGDHAPRDPS